jgi:peptidoglycan/LPS O-acetylase OafA/YrhL
MSLPKTLNVLDREPAFDGIRAVAVVVVLIFHADLGIPFLSSGGAAGVDAFFVLSGYLITRILLQEYGQTGQIRIKRFYLRRLVRLWPALATVVCVVLIPGLLIFDDQSVFLASSLAALFYLYPIATSGFNLPPLGYGHTWTLSLEEYFYFLFPPLLWWLLGRIRKRNLIAWLLFCISALSFICISVVNLVVTPDQGVTGIWGYLRVAGIGLGCALAIYLDNLGSNRVSTIRWDWIGVCLLIASFVVSSSLPLRGVSYWLIALATMAVILAIVTQARHQFRRVLGSRLMSFIGKISYEIYLWHYILLILATQVATQSFAAAAIWAYPPTIVLAILTHKLWLPFQSNMKRKIDSSVT